MQYTKTKDDHYKLETSLDDTIEKMDTFKNELFGKITPLLNNNKTISNIQQQLFLASYVVNDFLKQLNAPLVDLKPVFIKVNIRGRIFTVTLGLYNGTFLYSIDS